MSVKAKILIPILTVLALGSPAAPAGEEPAEEPGGWIGVWLGNIVDGGVEVVALVPGGPSQQAGVRMGDILLQANEVDLTEQEKLRGVLDAVRPGDPVRLVVLRDGRPLEILVTAAAPPRFSVTRDPTTIVRIAPPAPPAPDVAAVESRLSGEVLGLRLSGVTPQLRRHYGAPDDAGVLVVALDRDKLAARAGLQVGDVLVTLDEHKIVSPAQLESTLLTWNSNRPLRAEIVRDREPRRIVLVTPGDQVASSRAEVSGKLEAARRAWQESQRQLDANRLELEIRQLEARLEELRRQLAELRDER